MYATAVGGTRPHAPVTPAPVQGISRLEGTVPTLTPDDQPPRPQLDARCAAGIEACWPLVHVECAQISTGGVSDCARAVVQLGRLTPADVRVELMPSEPEGPEAAPPAERRMFSIQSYDNGCFLFEASLPQGVTAHVHDWLIHVHPHEAVDEPRVEYHLRTPE